MRNSCKLHFSPPILSECLQPKQLLTNNSTVLMKEDSIIHWSSFLTGNEYKCIFSRKWFGQQPGSEVIGANLPSPRSYPKPYLCKASQTTIFWLYHETYNFLHINYFSQIKICIRRQLLFIRGYNITINH